MWLYIPDLPSSQEQAALNSDSPLRSELITDQSPTLKGSVRPLRSWLRTWKEGGWIRLLSGMTLQPSQAMSLAHSWIRSTLCQRDSLASRGQSQETEKELKMNDGSGLISSDWFARYDPEASSWRTSQVSFMEELNTFSETWPRSGSMRNGHVSERQTLAHRTGGNESSSWPTAQNSDWKGANHSGSGSNSTRGLSTTSENWATPRANDPEKRGNIVKHWQTPSANEDAAGTINGNMQHMLSHQVQVATGITSTNDTGQRLNPLFVEWLMGWPEGWLELSSFVSSETE